MRKPKPLQDRESRLKSPLDVRSNNYLNTAFLTQSKPNIAVRKNASLSSVIRIPTSEVGPAPAPEPTVSYLLDENDNILMTEDNNNLTIE